VTTVAGFVVCAAAGALARWWAIARGHRPFPLPTLLVNVSGAFALGCLAGADVTGPVATVLGTGFLGAYTTFSSFTREVHDLATTGHRAEAAAYVAASIAAGALAAHAGLALTS
jgi:CrcB protein